ncbi:prolipoprotein diacylglyceryl transferase family protein [Hymenobacter baengnokdamensis]|uniref:prolipoprotein diacylglyceryl transferase family protein n=1 Tax=Hymenobacter baengnokdamensis TaxID=2615203 RepID=UPI001245F79B|nr:prolipoprotein diacylglyceryl transferase family protein [Hymenobacter baengnokdamensis]
MALLYTLPALAEHPYYNTAQLAAFAVFVAGLLAQGYQRGYPWRHWLPLVAAATLALIVGCQLVFLPPANWWPWLRGDVDIARALGEGPRSVVGGAAASLLAVVALRRLLGFRGWAVLDAFAAPLCWALAVQCVGCLLAGCCWGEVAAPHAWGLCYGPGTLPYLAQQAQGQLPAGAAHSLPVVPTQLYQLLLCAGTGLILSHLSRRVAWPGGSQYLLGMGLLCLGRFVIEFWREPLGEPLLAAPVLVAGFSLLRLQALLLLEATALLGSWGWLARRGQQAEQIAAHEAAAPAGYPALVGLALLAATSRLGPGVLSRPEVLILQALLLLVLLAEGYTALAFISRLVPRLVALPLGTGLAGVLLLTMAQAPAPQQAAPPASADEFHQTLVFSGGMLGSYHEAQEDILTNPSGCGSSQLLALHQRVRAGGGEAALVTTTPTGTGTWGGGLWVGQQQVGIQVVPTSGHTSTYQDTTLRYQLADIHLYREVQTDRGWLSVGVRTGLHIGSLGYYSYFDNDHSQSSTWLMPELMLSLGNPRVLYSQADFCYGAENAMGAYTTRLALGSGLGTLGGSNILAGYAHSPHQPTPSMAFVSARLRLPGGTGLSALGLEPYFATDFGRHQIFSLKMSYRLAR